MAPASAATSGTFGRCHTQTNPFGASIYNVCLSGESSWDGSHAAGYVKSVYCNVSLPTGIGWSCNYRTYGAYWNSSIGAWEEWLNFRLNYVLPFLVYHSDCVYLRIDTRPNGYTTYQDFANRGLPIFTNCG
jgi:hypothetical protein